MEPHLSICIPTVDRLHYLREAVESALGQRMANVEIVIADDGDSRELREWAQREAAGDDRIRYLTTPGPLGLAGAWNFLADAASAEFMTIIGDDDRLRPEFVNQLLEQVTPDVAVVFSNHYIIDAAGLRQVDATRRHHQQYGREALPPGRLVNPAATVWRNSIPMSACIVRTSDVRRLRFKTDINTPEIELFARLALEGRDFVFVSTPLAEYRLHADSETARGLTLDRLAGTSSRFPCRSTSSPLSARIWRRCSMPASRFA